ncbi:PASTA domain-containing protein [Thiocapsa bogorovii]|uniref:PASTA domain-containing protein n=1 Tax=Thiocapsa bogorovii TaxID=521689 RepID=UPI0038CDA476
MIGWLFWALFAAAFPACLQATENLITAPTEPLRLAQRDEEPSRVRVPDVRGRNITQAEAVILRAGLSPGRMTPQDSDWADNTVLRQDPAPGQQVQHGTPVGL